MRRMVWLGIVLGLLWTTPVWSQDETTNEAESDASEGDEPAAGGDAGEGDEPAAGGDTGEGDEPEAEEEDPKTRNHGVAGFQLDGMSPIGDFGDTVELGGGGGLFGGYEMHHGPVMVTYIVQGSFHFVPSPGRPNADADVDVKRLMGGVRVGYEKVLIYEAFLSLGYGWLTGTSARESEFSEGFSMETGLGLGYEIVDHLTIGIRGGYGLLDGSFKDNSPAHWALFGGQFTVGF